MTGTQPARITDPGFIEERAANLARGMVEFYREPVNQAMCSGFILSAAFYAGSRKARLVPLLLVAMTGGLSARAAYRVAENIADIAEAARSNGADPAEP